MEEEVKDIAHAESYAILAKIGKRVLRPGGRELTMQLIDSLAITETDKITEFAPGQGFTASLVVLKNPESYIGIERDGHHINALKHKVKSSGNTRIEFIQGDAEDTGLATGSRDKLFGEAMLSMHANQRKTRIIKEASRILKTGGLYAIHELELNIDDAEKEKEIQKNLSQVSKVNARPITVSEWTKLLEDEGFEVIGIQRRPLRVLEPSRIIADEGFFQTLRIGFNVLTMPKVRKRVLEMRRTFKQHDKHLNAIAILARKV